MNPSFQNKQPWLCYYLEHTPKSVHTVVGIKVKTIGQTTTSSSTQPKTMGTTTVVYACSIRSYILNKMV